MSLRIWLPLNGNLTQQGLDDIIVTNNGATIDNNGKIGKCYSFSGNAMYGDLPNINNMTEMSGCCWVYLTNINTAQYMFHLGGQGSYICKMSLDYDGDFRSIVNGKEYRSGITLTTNTWTHIAITVSNNTIKWYKDGVEQVSKTISGTFVASDHFAIGARTSSANGTSFAYPIINAGKLNDVRIYDHCLSPKEVKEISKGLILHYKLDGKFLEDNAEYDCSGYNNETSIIETLTDSTDTPRYNKSTKFNGSNSAIKIINNNWMPQGMPAMTINLWAKNSSWNSNTHFFSCTESGGFNTETGQSGYLRFPVHVYTTEDLTNTAYKYDSKELQLSALSTTDWNMITWVYDSTGTKTYINGVLHHTYTNTSYGIHFNTNARLFLGCEASGANPSSPYYDGYMSDFRLYATAFSADDILELYQTAASIDNKGNLFCGEVVE